MIKFSLITLFTSIALFFSAIIADGVVIDHILPATLNPGEKTTVTVNINKGEVTGFAKLQLEIPAGLTATAIKKSGASFTFSGQKAKFIWMTLPDTQQFQVEYELEANLNLSGSKVIEGQFSYIKQNERIDYDLSPQIINIGETLVDNTSNQQEEETSTTDTSTDESKVVCFRTLTPIGNGEYFVELSAEDVTTDGFSKIVEEVSEGFEIKEDSSGESVVTIEDNTIKFVWFEKPSDPNYNVTYTLKGDGSKSPELDGKFSYIIDNAPYEAVINHQDMVSSRDFSNVSEDLAEEPVTTPEPETTTPEVTEPATAEITEATETLVEETPEVIPADIEEEEIYTDNTDAITNIPEPETGINYKVQLSATHKYISAKNFAKKHGFTAAIQTENHEGWTKFVTGSHLDYRLARDARNEINSKYKTFKGPFVTAYNNGDRITVQEALMISKQKWYQ